MTKLTIKKLLQPSNEIDMLIPGTIQFSNVFETDTETRFASPAFVKMSSPLGIVRRVNQELTALVRKSVEKKLQDQPASAKRFIKGIFPFRVCHSESTEQLSDLVHFICPIKKTVSSNNDSIQVLRPIVFDEKGLIHNDPRLIDKRSMVAVVVKPEFYCMQLTETMDVVGISLYLRAIQYSNALLVRISKRSQKL